MDSSGSSNPFRDPVYHFQRDQSDGGSSIPENFQFTFRSPIPSLQSDAGSPVPSEEPPGRSFIDTPANIASPDDNHSLDKPHTSNNQHQQPIFARPQHFPAQSSNFASSIPRPQPKPVGPSLGSTLLDHIKAAACLSNDMRLPFQKHKPKAEAGPSGAAPDQEEEQQSTSPAAAEANEGQSATGIDAQDGTDEYVAYFPQGGQSASTTSYSPFPQSNAIPVQLRRGHANCTHPTMVRMYCFDETCDVCHDFGQFGWLYRCTQDREEIIQEQLRRGNGDATFDEIGAGLSKLVGPCPRGAESRATDKYSFFKEITPEQLKTYMPEQIETILRQRENVKETIEKQMAQRKEVTDEENRRMMQSLTMRPARGQGTTTEASSFQKRMDKTNGQEKEVSNGENRRAVPVLRDQGQPVSSPEIPKASQSQEQQVSKGDTKENEGEKSNEQLLQPLHNRPAGEAPQAQALDVATPFSQLDLTTPAERQAWFEASIRKMEQEQGIRPWVPRPEHECQYKVCQSCRPGCIDRTHLSLDGIAMGDIPATAATGFGFHVFQRRPVADVDIICGTENATTRIIRPIPVRPYLNPTVSGPGTSHFRPTPGGGDLDAQISTKPTPAPGLDSVGPSTPPHLYNAGTTRVDDTYLPNGDPPDGSSTIPVTPSRLVLHEAAHLPRSPASADLPHLTNEGYAAAVSRTKRQKKGKNKDQTNGQQGDTGDKATRISTDMEEREREKGEFGRGPLEVEDGVAVSEEGVQLHKADVITHKE